MHPKLAALLYTAGQAKIDRYAYRQSVQPDLNMIHVLQNPIAIQSIYKEMWNIKNVCTRWDMRPKSRAAMATGMVRLDVR